MECYRLTIDTPVGPLTLTATERGAAHVDFDGGAAQDAREAAGEYTRRRGMPFDARAQLEAYFAGALRAFTLPLDMQGGSSFRLQTLAAVRRVPYGHTVTYSALAESIDPAASARAIGRALACNALPILIPCHRIVGKNGLGAYVGGHDIKEALLRLEGAL